MEKQMEEEKNEIKRKADHERKMIESQKNMAEEERVRLIEQINNLSHKQFLVRVQMLEI